jgi:tellurite methyltransferase
MTLDPSIDFFDRQFGRQIAAGEFALNPFETLALPHLKGSVLDFGCGLGNLALHAARSGLDVVALDASESAIAHLRERARSEQLPLHAELADLRTHTLERQFDTVVSIGLLMFFDCTDALRQLAHLQSRVASGGTAVVNVLVEGTTFMDMFSSTGHCLLPAGELERRFAGWTIVTSEHATFPAPRDTLKVFDTVVARKPASG